MAPSTIFYPFAQMSRLARADVLRASVECETYGAAYYSPHDAKDAFYPVPRAAYLKLSAVANESGGLTLFALNRDVEQEMTVLVNARGFGRLAVAEATVLTDSDLKAANSESAPDRVKPAKLSGVAVGSETVRIELPPASWSVVHLTAESELGNPTVARFATAFGWARATSVLEHRELRGLVPLTSVWYATDARPDPWSWPHANIAQPWV